MEVYQKDQAKVLFPYWPAQAEWFIVGGTADAYEGQTIKQAYPNVNCIGFEPMTAMRQRQEALQFPGLLLPYALWDKDGEEIPLTGEGANLRSYSIAAHHPEATADVATTRTLDSLSAEYGPFNNAVLWLDIEHAELQALHGADSLLTNHQILLVNVETLTEQEYDSIVKYLHRRGYHLKHVWNTGGEPRGRRECIFGL